MLMAQSLEKAFLQKVAQMPQEELELPPPPPRVKQAKLGRKGRGNARGVSRSYSRSYQVCTRPTYGARV